MWKRIKDVICTSVRCRVFAESNTNRVWFEYSNICANAVGDTFNFSSNSLLGQSLLNWACMNQMDVFFAVNAVRTPWMRIERDDRDASHLRLGCVMSAFRPILHHVVARLTHARFSIYCLILRPQCRILAPVLPCTFEYSNDYPILSNSIQQYSCYMCMLVAMHHHDCHRRGDIMTTIFFAFQMQKHTKKEKIYLCTVQLRSLNRPKPLKKLPHYERSKASYKWE